MAICRPKAIDDAPVFGPERSGGWRRRDFLGSRGMGEAQGKKVDPSAVAAQAIEAPPSFGQIKPSEATWLAPVQQHCGEDVADIE